MRLRDQFPSGRFSGKSFRNTLEKAGLFLLIFYVLAGLIYSAVLPPLARFPDENEYLKLSDNLLHGPGYSMDGVQLTANRPPGYAFFLCAIQAMGGGYFWFRAIQFLLLGGTILLVYRLCPGPKMFAGLLTITSVVICYPILFYTSSTLYPQTLCAFLFVLFLKLILTKPGGLVLHLAAGLVFGALILVAPTFLLTLVVVLVVATFLKLIRWQDALPITLAALLVVGTWTVRNEMIFHRFVPVASNSGVNLLMGNNEGASPFEAAVNLGMAPYFEHTTNLAMNEFDADEYYKRSALDWMEAHPGQALVLYFEKVLNFFNIVNSYVAGNHGEITVWKQVVMAVSYLFLLALLVWRLSDVKRYPLVSREKFFLAVYVLSAFTSAIFFTRIRHRVPFDYLIILVVASYLSRRLEVWSQGSDPHDLSALHKKA